MPAKGEITHRKLSDCKKKNYFRMNDTKIINRWYSHHTKWEQWNRTNKARKRMRMCWCVCVCVLLKFIKLEHSFFTVDGDWSALEIASPFFATGSELIIRVANNRMIHSWVSHFMWYNHYYGLFIIGHWVAQIVEIGFLCQSEKPMAANKWIWLLSPQLYVHIELTWHKTIRTNW